MKVKYILLIILIILLIFSGPESGWAQSELELTLLNYYRFKKPEFLLPIVPDIENFTMFEDIITDPENAPACHNNCSTGRTESGQPLR